MTEIPVVSKVFVAYETNEEQGGKSTSRVIGIFSNGRDALNAAKGRGWYGGNGVVEIRWAMITSPIGYPRQATILEGLARQLDVDLIKQEEDDRAAARAKLTHREAVLLGVTK